LQDLELVFCDRAPRKESCGFIGREENQKSIVQEGASRWDLRELIEFAFRWLARFDIAS